MKKGLIVFLAIVCFCLTVEAKMYVLRDKLTGKPQGTASIAEENIDGWAEKHILTEADNSYRGKHGYEIVYENGELRHATQAEIDSYLQVQEQAQQDTIKAKKKQELLDLLEDVEIIDKIKDKVKP